jgi:serine/threonine protein kinase
MGPPRCPAGPRQLGEARDWGCQLLEILAEAHSQGVLHRHIGEDQIVVASDGQLFLTGFGLTSIFFDPLTTFPPKHALDEPCSVLTDLYAVGLLLRRLAFASGKSRGSTRRDPLLKVLARATWPDPARTSLFGWLRA